MGFSLSLPLKGATKSYFMYYSRVVIIFFSTGLEKSVFSSTYSFGLSFCFIFSRFCFFVVLHYVLNSMSSLLGKVQSGIKNRSCALSLSSLNLLPPEVIHK